LKKTKKNIIWLASYPKSGNTWIRILLTHYLKKENESFDLNNLLTDGIASNRNIFEDATGLNSSDLTNDETENLRPDVYRYMAENAEEPLYIKIHDANIKNSGGEYIIPDDVTSRVIYLIRNPLDVAVSMAYHSATEIDRAVEFICNENATFCSSNKLLTIQLQQKLLSWNNHVKSWINDKRFSILIVRYEDLLADTYKVFERIINFLGYTVDKMQLRDAVNSSKFDKISKKENETGFNEKSLYARSFFRKGINGDWVNHLAGYHVERIKTVNKEMMQRFGYLKNC